MGMRKLSVNKSILAAVMILMAEGALAQSSPRRIPQEDMATTRKESASAVAPVGSHLAYTAAAVPTPAPASNMLNPFAGFTPPPVNASPDVMNQAIQNFMQYMNGVDQAGNPQGFPDWVNPEVIRRGQRAPPLPPISGTSLDSSCSGLNPEALEKMRKYIQDCGANIQSRSGKVAINDFSTNTPSMYILDQDTLSCVGSTRITYGIGSQSSRPRAGNGHSSHMTPAGFHVTKPHNGTLYQEWNSVGLAGMGNENSNTIGRGVIIHPSNGSTLGCIGIPPSRFVTVKNAIAYGSVVYNYYPGQTGSSQNRCPAYSSQRSRQASGVR